MARIGGGDASPDTDEIPDAGPPPVAPPATGTPADAGPASPAPDVPDRGTLDRGTADAGAGSGGRTEAVAPRVNLSITWHGMFGGDLSADVQVLGVVKGLRKKDYPVLAQGSAEDHDKTGGKAAERLAPVVVSVPWFDTYRIVITPWEDKGRYLKTSADKQVLPSREQIPIDVPLEINRNDKRNVDDRMRWEKIDPTTAGRVVSSVPLFGRNVTVHLYVIPRVIRTNVLFATLPPAVQAEIIESIYYLEGYVRRTTTQGGLSNHSLGVAFDINVNSKTKQDDHFFRKNTALLVRVVQPIVRTDPRFSAFDLLEAKGQTQLEASRVFIERFPIFVATVLGEIGVVNDLTRYSMQPGKPKRAALDDPLGPWHATVKALSSPSNHARFTRLRKQVKDRKVKDRLRRIDQNWKILFTWALGANVKDRVAKRTKRGVGMIPLHPKLLEVMLAAGWSWGGDWKHEKDYMHFEDAEAQTMMLTEPPPPTTRRKKSRR